MPTCNQSELHRKLDAMFGRTPDWRALHAGRDFSRMNASEGYVFLASLFTALKPWRFRRLPRAVGLPRTQEDRDANRRRARKEEAHARLVVPQDERETWQVDTRPPAFGHLDYLETNPELKESLMLDHPALFRDTESAS